MREMVDVLSHKRGVGLDVEMSKSLRRLRIRLILVEVEASARYFASVVCLSGGASHDHLFLGSPRNRCISKT